MRKEDSRTYSDSHFDSIFGGRYFPAGGRSPFFGGDIDDPKTFGPLLGPDSPFGDSRHDSHKED